MTVRRAPASRKRRDAASYLGGQGWQMDVGALHGIPSATVSGRPATVTVHELTAEDLSEEQALARAHTSFVRATSSDLVIDGDARDLDPNRAYRAVIRDLPAADVLVSVDDSVPCAGRLVDALSVAQGLSVVGSGECRRVSGSAAGSPCTILTAVFLIRVRAAARTCGKGSLASNATRFVAWCRLAGDCCQAGESMGRPAA